MSFDVLTEPTPNPNSLKFIVNVQVKEQGRSTFRTTSDCEEVPLASDLFKIRGVDHVHFFQNVITVTKFSYEDWDILEPKLTQAIKGLLPGHDPSYVDRSPEEQRREQLSPELQAIEKILDSTIRPALQADGGDLQCVDYRDNVVVIQYEGACGSCPSSQYGTLQAIQGILRAEYNSEIEVVAAQMES